MYFQVLCLHVKRFKWVTSFRQKLETYIEFPLTNLDMNKYILDIVSMHVCSFYICLQIWYFETIMVLDNHDFNTVKSYFACTFFCMQTSVFNTRKSKRFMQSEVLPLMKSHTFCIGFQIWPFVYWKKAYAWQDIS